MKMTEEQISQLIYAQQPPQNTSELGTVSAHMEVNKQFFTGWKGAINGVDLFYRGPADEGREWDIPDDIKIGYVAQWTIPIVDGSTYKIIFVNLPGMESGVVPYGASFDIGSQRVYGDTPVEELNLLIEAGHAKLMELVAQEKSKVA